ncbi:MAG: NAD(P)/FAD-dependent oxidoreductase [Candidatus Kaelpia imicola]|nr:NAD(P)/FAD-dependent oxidoreductase [Candidatus Kaelpia imicola]
MYSYDIAVIGGGAAGSIAAITAALSGKNIVLVERNSSIGHKILLSGKKRCNITNSADIDSFIEVFGKQGRFLRQSFNSFFNDDLIYFFKNRGLKMKVERQGRVFPVTDRSSSVVEVLERAILESKNIKTLFNAPLKSINRESDFFSLGLKNNKSVYAKKVIVATGGASYKMTGSLGDGFDFAKKLGHTIIPLKPGLVPLKTEEIWVKRLQGLSLKNIRVIFSFDKIKESKKRKKIVSPVGEIIFTHFGVSGPLILDLSADVVSLLQKYDQIDMLVDLKPGLSNERLEKRLLKEIESKSKMKIKNVIRSLLPRRMASVFLYISGISEDKKVNTLSRGERQRIIQLLKGLPLTVTGSLAIDSAMVTNGGVSIKEINPRTMESKIAPGLYFAGEIIDGCAKSGGYNLQQAFSTGYIAGRSAGDG